MTHDRNFLDELTQLPESLARALVADANCQAYLEPRDESEKSIVNVTSLDNYQPEASDDRSELYRVGEVYVAFELKGDSLSEVVAFHGDDLREYVDTVFVDEPTRLVVTSEIGIDDLDSFVS